MGIVTVRSVAEIRQTLAAARASGRRIALVPTMGALHAGHLALVREARHRAGGDRAFVVASVFVNPTQFGPNEDFARYPRNLVADVARCEEAGADAVFAPDVPEMYPPGETTRVRVGGLSEPLCGRHRPGHFEGVATVVAKFFGVFAPCVAVFGRKDYQQLRILETLARDLCYEVEVVAHPIVREPDGLAMSSRNAYLSPDDRIRARAISRGLAAACQAYAGGERSPSVLREKAERIILPSVDSVDYLELVDPVTLGSFPAGGQIAGRALLAAAVRVGTTRLIDNVVLGEDAAPIP